jgi:hypothetical protein
MPSPVSAEINGISSREPEKKKKKGRRRNTHHQASIGVDDIAFHKNNG